MWAHLLFVMFLWWCAYKLCMCGRGSLYSGGRSTNKGTVM